MMQPELFKQMERTERLVGRDGLKKLHSSRVAVVGLGGVGSFALEALVRAGIGSLVLVDHDVVELTNLNRQLLALHSTLGLPKVEAARRRAMDINPQVKIDAWPIFCGPDNCRELLSGQLDYVVDAIDVVASKVALLRTARELDRPVASSMGMGNKLDPTALRVADISATQVCPLARVIRRELRRYGIVTGIQTVFSIEPSLKETAQSITRVESDSIKGLAFNAALISGPRIGPGSISYVPSIAGLMLAGIVIRGLLGLDQDN